MSIFHPTGIAFSFLFMPIRRLIDRQVNEIGASGVVGRRGV
jgi:hypothetical protein